MKAKGIKFEEFFGTTGLSNTALFAREPEIPFTEAKGFHIYGELSLHLRLCAAENDQKALKYLGLLQNYADIAQECGKLGGVRIFEIHGERIHLFIPSERPDPITLAKVISFATAFTQTIYKQLAQRAGDDWDGFKMATDWGQAILLRSETGGGSLISLGNCANAPAKRLEFVPAAHLSVRTELLKKEFPQDSWGQAHWTDLNVLTPSKWLSRFADPVLTNQMQGLANSVFQKARAAKTISLINIASFNEPGAGTVTSPMRVQGYVLRADLDGFSKEVEAAFLGGPQAVMKLVERFIEIMKFPGEVARAIKRPIIEMPWAGDCATMVILARPGEPFPDTRRSMPVTIPLAWHSHAADKWGNQFKTTKWAVGLACGTKDEGNDGFLLVANIETESRTYRMISGWSAKRSHDAYQSAGVKGDDTLIPHVDHAKLDDRYKGGFQEHDSRFMRAPFSKLAAAQVEREKKVAVTEPVHLPKVNVHIPPAKPHAS